MTAVALPSGEVTFVLTDIEGSTKMFRRLGDGYPPLLDAHNALLREQWVAHGGAEVKTVGDAFIVAFDSAANAMAASVAAQRAMATHAWPPDAVMRIRVGVHTGTAFARDGDYVALALHQAARVVGAANGGQVIASDDAVAAAGDTPAVRYRPVGAYRLRDFERPVRLAAVLGVDEHADGPVSVRAVPADGHNLVAPVTSFVGRAAEVADVAGRLRAGRAVTIVGPGGMGKTRLATEVGLRVAASWPDGVWFVDLSTVTEPRLVATAVAEAVRAPLGGSADEAADVINHLRGREAVVILDNCEHVLAAVDEVIAALLTGCERVAILATSRVPLALPGEELWRIDPLPVSEECVQLFVDRARARVPDFELSADGAPIVAEICRHLDGMPLAIELAAARLSVLSPAEILEGLQQRFRLLRTSDPTAAPRQRSMRALLDWGQALLSPAEQAVFARLSVFRAPFDLDAAAAAGFGTVDPDDVADIVWSLADGSLLAVDRTEGHTRYRMLETVRAYAADRLDDIGDAPAMRQRLADHYLAHYTWANIAGQTTLSALSMEADTVVALVDGLLDDGRDDGALALARILAVVHHAQGRLTLALDGLEQAIGRAGTASAMLARAHLGAHLAAAALGRVDVAEGHLDQARRLVAEHGSYDRWGHVSLARAESVIAMRRGSRDDMARGAGHLRTELEEDGLSDSDRIDILISLGEVEGELGRADAVPVLTAAVELLRRSPPDVMLAAALSSLAEHELRAGDDAAAARHQQESMYLAVEGGAPVLVGSAFVVAARLAERYGLSATATRLHGAADVLYEDAGFELMAGDQALSDAMRHRMQAELGPERVSALTREGRALDRLAAMELADAVFRRAGADGS